MRTSRHHIYALLLFALLVFGGCSRGPRLYPAGGTVTFRDGTPVRSGKLEFRSVDTQMTARAKIDQDGSFRVTTFEAFDGAVAGKHEVVLIQTMVVANVNEKEHQEHSRMIDKKYGRYDTSGLEITIDPSGDNDNLSLLVD